MKNEFFEIRLNKDNNSKDKTAWEKAISNKYKKPALSFSFEHTELKIKQEDIITKIIEITNIKPTL